MKETVNRKTKWLNIRLSEQEYNHIENRYKATDCRKMGTWARLVLLEKPIVTITRNQSEDDMMAELSMLRTELKAIGTNFNQAVKKIHTLSHIKELEHWLVVLQMDKDALEKHYLEIESQVKKMAAKWLR